MSPTKSNIYLTLISFSSAWITYFAHEVFHWSAYSLLKVKTHFKLNTIELLDNNLLIPDSKQIIIYGSGIDFTFFQAFLCFYVLKRKQIFWLFALLIAAFELRLLAAILNFSKPSDEGKISLLLGLPLHTLSVVVVGGMGYFFFKTATTKKFVVKETFLSAVVVFIAIYLFSLIQI